LCPPAWLWLAGWLASGVERACWGQWVDSGDAVADWRHDLRHVTVSSHVCPHSCVAPPERLFTSQPSLISVT
jgi:hypothetical protein